MELNIATQATARAVEPSIAVSNVSEYFESNVSTLLELLDSYYEYLNSKDQASFTLNNLTRQHDIDVADEYYLEQIRRTIAISTPTESIFDKRRLYKILLDFYHARGSAESIEAFFKLFFNENVTIWYPKDYLFDTSGSRSVASANFRIQDSYKWQDFSYIVDGVIDPSWRKEFERFIHPAGLKLFVALGINALSESGQDVGGSNLPWWSSFIGESNPLAFVGRQQDITFEELEVFTNPDNLPCGSRIYKPSPRYHIYLPDEATFGTGARFFSTDSEVLAERDVAVIGNRAPGAEYDYPQSVRQWKDYDAGHWNNVMSALQYPWAYDQKMSAKYGDLSGPYLPQYDADNSVAWNIFHASRWISRRHVYAPSWRDTEIAHNPQFDPARGGTPYIPDYPDPRRWAAANDGGVIAARTGGTQAYTYNGGAQRIGGRDQDSNLWSDLDYIGNEEYTDRPYEGQGGKFTISCWLKRMKENEQFWIISKYGDSALGRVGDTSLNGRKFWAWYIDADGYIIYKFWTYVYGYTNNNSGYAQWKSKHPVAFDQYIHVSLVHDFDAGIRPIFNEDGKYLSWEDPTYWERYDPGGLYDFGNNPPIDTANTYADGRNVLNTEDEDPAEIFPANYNQSYRNLIPPHHSRVKIYVNGAEIELETTFYRSGTTYGFGYLQGGEYAQSAWSGSANTQSMTAIGGAGGSILVAAQGRAHGYMADFRISSSALSQERIKEITYGAEPKEEDLLQAWYFNNDNDLSDNGTGNNPLLFENLVRVNQPTPQNNDYWNHDYTSYGGSSLGPDLFIMGTAVRSGPFAPVADILSCDPCKDNWAEEISQISDRVQTIYNSRIQYCSNIDYDLLLQVLLPPDIFKTHIHTYSADPYASYLPNNRPYVREEWLMQFAPKIFLDEYDLRAVYNIFTLIFRITNARNELNLFYNPYIISEKFRDGSAYMDGYLDHVIGDTFTGNIDPHEYSPINPSQFKAYSPAIYPDPFNASELTFNP